MTFQSLRRAAIEAESTRTYQYYLAGRPLCSQPLAHIDDADIDFGIADYADATFSDVQCYPNAKEYHYVVRGMVEYRDLDSDIVHRFHMGDFYVILPGTRYIKRVKQHSRILFVKCPAGSEKATEFADENVLAWAQEQLRVDRIDLFGAEAPAANMMIPGATAAVIDDQHRLLMVQRRDSGNWTMPGGAMEIDDSLASCVCREVLEETGIEISILGIIGTYSDPATRVAYSDGEVRREFSILFHCRPTRGLLMIDDESTDARWVPLGEVFRLQMAESQRRRVEDVLSFVRTGAVIIR